MAERASYEQIPVDPHRRTPREEMRAALGRMVAQLDAMTPEQIDAMLDADSVDEAAAE